PISVAHHRDDATLALEAGDHIHLLRRQHLGNDLVDADLGGNLTGHGLVVAGQQDRDQPQLLHRGNGLCTGGLDRVGDHQDSAGDPVPADGDDGLALLLGIRLRSGHRRAQRHLRLGEEALAAHDDRVVLTGPRTPFPSTLVNSDNVGSWPTSWVAPLAIAWAIGCSEESSTAPARRSSSARSVPSSVTTSVRVILPVVTVPVLSSTTVSTLRVDSSTSGPLMSTPIWAPRPVPTSRAVGVARPSAQGQAITSTATAAVKAAV